MKVTKMQGLGNDYLYVYGEVPDNIREISVRLSDRHFGIGSDGMIYISSSETADFKMRIFNADGSEAQMCGNGIRCVGKYLYEKGYTNKQELNIETLSGIKKLKLRVCNDVVEEVQADMGIVRVTGETELDTAPVTNVVYVDAGNPHAVSFTDDIMKISLTDIGPQIEHHKVFPEGINAEFVQIISKNELRMRVWERGSAVTMACGTGACASCTAAVYKGICSAGEPITVHLDGGDLKITVTDNWNVLMTGPAAFICEADTDIVLKK